MGQESFGRYEIIKELGRGSMGVVYKARDPLLKRHVAIKSMGDAARADPDFVKRFFREAEATAGLNHPNIVAVYDIGESESQPYIAIEYLEGDDLGTILDKGAFIPFERKLDIVMQLCEGLEHAHSRGVVHRDIKPSNVQLTPGGTVKIVDFGIAKLVSSNLTTTGQLMGTPSYMAPEQVAGKRVDSRSDIFGVGVMLYQLATGRKPFEGGDFRSVMFAIATEPHAPIDTLLPACCKDLVTVVDLTLAKDPDERFKSARELRDALHKIRHRLPQLCDQVRADVEQLRQDLDVKREQFTPAGELRNFAAELLETPLASAPDVTVWGPHVVMEEDYGYLLANHAQLSRNLEGLDRVAQQQESLQTLASRTRQLFEQGAWGECLGCVEEMLEAIPDSLEAKRIEQECRQQTEKDGEAPAEAGAGKPDEAPAVTPEEEASQPEEKEYLEAVEEEPPPDAPEDPGAPEAPTPVPPSPALSRRILLWFLPSALVLLLVWAALYWVSWETGDRPVVVYQVKQGDTLEGISSRFGLPVQGLTDHNPAVDPEALVPGQIINLASPPRDAGMLVLDFAPWATVESMVRSEDGAEVLGGTAYTPVTISLPAGLYVVKASNPVLGSTLEFNVAVEAGTVKRERRPMPGFELEAELEALFGDDSQGAQ